MNTLQRSCVPHLLQRAPLPVFSSIGNRFGLGRKLAVLLTVVALLSAIATYAAFTGMSPIGTDTRTVLILLQIDLVVFLLLGLVVARNLVGLWMERRRGQVGSRLHTRLVVLFSLIALAPAIIVSVFSAFFLQLWDGELVQRKSSYGDHRLESGCRRIFERTSAGYSRRHSVNGARFRSRSANNGRKPTTI